MKPNSYETVLKETASPAPDPQARLLAKRAALAEFARVNAGSAAPADARKGFFQGLSDAWRLSRERQSHGSDVMGWNARSKMFAGAASVCLAVVGLAVVWPMIKDGNSARLLERTGAESVAVEPVRPEVAASEAAESGRSGAEAGQDASSTRAALFGPSRKRPPPLKNESSTLPVLAVVSRSPLRSGVNSSAFRPFMDDPRVTLPFTSTI
jgi:hypothetical protein